MEHPKPDHPNIYRCDFRLITASQAFPASQDCSGSLDACLTNFLRLLHCYYSRIFGPFSLSLLRNWFAIFLLL